MGIGLCPCEQACEYRYGALLRVQRSTKACRRPCRLGLLHCLLETIPAIGHRPCFCLPDRVQSSAEMRVFTLGMLDDVAIHKQFTLLTTSCWIRKGKIVSFTISTLLMDSNSLARTMALKTFTSSLIQTPATSTRQLEKSDLRGSERPHRRPSYYHLRRRRKTGRCSPGHHCHSRLQRPCLQQLEKAGLEHARKALADGSRRRSGDSGLRSPSSAIKQTRSCSRACHPN